MKNPFIVNIADIRRILGAHKDVERSGHIPELFVSASSVPTDQPVNFVGAIETIEGPGVVATGTVTTKWVGDCRRCLGPASGEVNEKVREVFQPDAVEGETYPVSGDTVDIEPLLRETVMLELPEAPLCREDCAGLCPTCGTNWNEAQCDCVHEVTDIRWAALDKLKGSEN